MQRAKTTRVSLGKRSNARRPDMEGSSSQALAVGSCMQGPLRRSRN
jgi:hypothetical protein